VYATNVRSFLTIPITSIAASRAHVYVGTDAYVYYEMSGFVVTNLNVGTRFPVMATLTAHTNAGRGIFFSAIPEPAALVILLVTLRSVVPRRGGATDRARHPCA
jgi:hypothetical protein